MSVTEASTWVVEDVERLARDGCSPDQIADSLGIQPASLGKRLRRAGRADLARMFEGRALTGRGRQDMSKPIQNPGMTASESAHWNHLLGLVPVSEQRWMAHGACVRSHPDADAHRAFADQFFASEANPGRPKVNVEKESPATRVAKRICGGCSVRVECLMFALANKEPYGVWGTLGTKERSDMRAKNPDKYEVPSDGSCKRGHSAKHRVSDGLGSSKCQKCADIAAEKYRVGAA